MKSLYWGDVISMVLNYVTVYWIQLSVSTKNSERYYWKWICF